jgi:hypothetical protein
VRARAAQQRIPIGQNPIGDGGAEMAPPFGPGVAPAGEFVSATAVKTIPQFMSIFNITVLLEYQKTGAQQHTGWPMPRQAGVALSFSAVDQCRRSVV